MSVGEKAREALDLQSLDLPASLPVVRVEVEEYTDTTSVPSLRILVVLDESVDVQQVSGEDVGELKFAIGECLREQGITLFPYIFLAKQSELDELEIEERRSAE